MAGKVHLVGSLGLLDAEAAFRALSEHLGSLAPRYPDGESGVRSNWVGWQGAVFDRHPAFEKSGIGPTEQMLFQVRSDVNLSSLHFERIGYAEEALKSYSIFKKLKVDGTIPPGTEFQVSLPTPTAVISTFVALPDRAGIERAYTAIMKEELDAILNGIPHEELAIQWDVAIEVIAYAGALPLHYEDKFEGTIDRVIELLVDIPEHVTTGIHLCYGDPGHKHVIEPTNLGNCVKFANSLCADSPRHIDYIHVPVPRDRNDDGYYESLSSLHIGSTELVMGLVHHTDGEAGTRERIATANKYISGYDVATECGFGRRPEHTIIELLDIHRKVLMA